jgi:hypothetical protein
VSVGFRRDQYLRSDRSRLFALIAALIEPFKEDRGGGMSTAFDPFQQWQSRIALPKSGSQEILVTVAFSCGLGLSIRRLAGRASKRDQVAEGC